MPKVLVVDPRFDAYRDWADAAGRGEVLVHFRSSGQAALSLVRRVGFDLCIVGDDLEDMAGEDLRELLRSAEVGSSREVIAASAVRGTVPETLEHCTHAAARAVREHGRAVVLGMSRVSGSFMVSAAAAAAAMGVMLSR